ncbi:MAG TPA: cysteine rich repeat-containing protein, partial [Woeseiaceae bacterium]|nr:cysteine rich repeat-containing protein [Woeseiaceae bacterium]
MKKKMLWVPLLLALGGAAGAQEALLDYVVESCQPDLDRYCANVTPGEGRLLYCVAAHQDKISDQCEG